jgi:hypothetical protein
VPLISVATKTFSGDITVNVYKDGKVIKSVSNYPQMGMAAYIAGELRQEKTSYIDKQSIRVKISLLS